MNCWNRILSNSMVMGSMMLAQIAAGQSGSTGGGSQPYQPAVPTGTTTNVNGYYPGSYGGGTAAGSAMNGMANATGAMGNYNLSTSAAAVQQWWPGNLSIDRIQVARAERLGRAVTRQAGQLLPSRPRFCFSLPVGPIGRPQDAETELHDEACPSIP